MEGNWTLKREIMEVEIEPEVEAGSEMPLQEMPGTSKQGINDNNDNDTTIDDWVIDNMSDSEMDKDMCWLPSLEEPAIPDYDLTCDEASILDTQDKLNDIAIKEIVTSDCYKFLWTRDEKAFTAHRETFTGTSGPTFDITDQTRIVDIFYRMFGNDFIDLLCTETNRYASQKINTFRQTNNLTSESTLFRWNPTDRDEMISFLAILILQGLYPMPEEESYFSFNGFGTMPYFRKIMNSQRFLLLKSMLHFVDNEKAEQKSKLYKIQPLVDYFNKKFSTLYYPSQEIVIGESLLKCMGKSGLMQKISKAAQEGIKTYELCEASSGYLWNFFVYEGKNQTNTLHNIYTDKRKTDDTDHRPTPNTKERPTNLTFKIVCDLVEPLLHKGHTLILGNFYNSPLLARYLKRQKTDCFGTLRLNREFVPDPLKTVSKTQLQMGEVLDYYCSDLSITVFQDANLVALISTYHHYRIGTQAKYHKVSHKPLIVLDYNKFMGGVDRKDLFLSAQPIERIQNRRWFTRVFRRIFNVALFNCFILFKSAHPKISHRDFRTNLAESLLKIHRHIDLTMESRLITSHNGQTVIKPQKGTELTDGRPKMEERHFPVKNGFKYCRCYWCARRNGFSRTTWKCLECNVNLCAEKCFMEYHT